MVNTFRNFLKCCLLAPQASESTEKQLTTVTGLSRTTGSQSEETMDVPPEGKDDYNENNPTSVEKIEPSSDQKTDDKDFNDKSTPLIKVGSTWDKRMDDFSSITFDLTQKAVNQYINSEVIRTLEAVKGLEYSPENMIQFKIWPQGIIPFFIDTFSFDKILSDKLRAYLDSVNRLTGLQFVELPRPPADEMQRWVFFVNRIQMLDCYNYDERWGSPTGIQRATIGYDCFDNGGYMASLVLTMVSVAPQHVSPNRDKFIEVFEENCLEGPVKAHHFVAVSPQNWLFHDIEYDFLSAGHYPFHKYTINGNATIKPLKPVNIPVGETKGFSFTDVYKIRRLYNAITLKQNKEHQLSNCQKLYRPRKGTETETETKLYNSNVHMDGDGSLEYHEVPEDEGINTKVLEYKPVPMKLSKMRKARLTTEDPLKLPDIQSDDK